METPWRWRGFSCNFSRSLYDLRRFGGAGISTTLFMGGIPLKTRMSPENWWLEVGRCTFLLKLSLFRWHGNFRGWKVPIYFPYFCGGWMKGSWARSATSHVECGDLQVRGFLVMVRFFFLHCKGTLEIWWKDTTLTTNLEPEKVRCFFFIFLPFQVPSLCE